MQINIVSCNAEIRDFHDSFWNILLILGMNVKSSGMANPETVSGHDQGNDHMGIHLSYTPYCSERIITLFLLLLGLHQYHPIKLK